MDGKSLNLTEEKLHKLREILPEAFTENKIDWEKTHLKFFGMNPPVGLLIQLCRLIHKER